MATVRVAPQDLQPLGARPTAAGPGALRGGRGRHQLCRRRGERLVEVPEDVVDVLDADADAHQVGQRRPRPPAASSDSCWWVVEAGMDHQRARVADVGQVAAQLDATR